MHAAGRYYKHTMLEVLMEEHGIKGYGECKRGLGAEAGSGVVAWGEGLLVAMQRWMGCPGAYFKPHGLE